MEDTNFRPGGDLGQGRALAATQKEGLFPVGKAACAAPAVCFGLRKKKQKRSLQVRREGRKRPGTVSSSPNFTSKPVRMRWTATDEQRGRGEGGGEKSPPPADTGNKVEPHLGRARLDTMQTPIMLV